MKLLKVLGLAALAGAAVATYASRGEIERSLTMLQM